MRLNLVISWACRIFTDWSSIEVFANNGSLVMTEQIFPDTSCSDLAIYALEGTVSLRNLNVYQLNSIYTAAPLVVECQTID
jgi:fructan beta-fructosidase